MRKVAIFLVTVAASGCGGDVVGVSGAAYCDPVASWDAAADAFEWDVLDLVNQRRTAGATCGGQAFGPAPPLTMDPSLRCAARVHSLDMDTRDFFSHTNPSGEQPWDRMDRAEYDWSRAGENIAAGQVDPEDVMNSWMNSEGHCGNIMDPSFEHIGVGYVADGRLWTQVFGAE